MKIIDLLNKIANSEEVPKKIKYGEIYCYYRENRNEYVDYTNKPILNWDWIVMNNLNGEVEILEEEKKIPDDLYCWFTMDYNDDLHEVIKKSNINFRNISEKMDKILDYLDYLKSKGE